MFQVLNESYEEDIVSRILKVRNITDEVSDFLNPTYWKYWQDSFQMWEVQKWIDRILQAIKNNEKIMIFWDYDVDWVCSTYIIYSFFRKFLKYDNISVRLPSRLHDWYWIKNYHFDEIKSKWASLVITVDNWITAVWEAIYAKSLGIDLIITDHHQPLDSLPDAFALINPQTTDMRFKSLCWAWVAFKFIFEIWKILLPKASLKTLHDFMLPIVSIASVADCMPLIDENRLLVKKWIEIMNSWRGMPISLKNFIEYIWVKKINSTSIAFQIAPRLNAGWRMQTPFDSFNCLLVEDKTLQLAHLDKLENHNTQRRGLQDWIFKAIEENISQDDKIIVSYWEYHEWIIWIIAWKLTEKYQKPSCVIWVDEKKWIAVASLRAWEWFSIVDMLQDSASLLDRFGGHKRAWGFTVKLENLEALVERLKNYANNFEFDTNEKKLLVDTYLLEKDLQSQNLKLIESLEPFGEWNPAPLVAVQNFEIKNIGFVWKDGQHLKISGMIWEKPLNALWWSKASEKENLKDWITIVWGLKYSDYDRSSYIEIKKIF